MSMLGDKFQFPIRHVCTSHRAQSMRLAVLCPIFGEKAMVLQTVPKLFTSLRKMWFWQAIRMKEGGRALTKKRMVYLHNCPPFGVMTAAFPCVCTERFCPFCWGRRVGSAYERMNELLTAGAKLEIPEKFALLEFSQCFVSPLGEVTVKSLQPSLDFVRSMQTDKLRRYEVDLYDAQGGFTWQCLAPRPRDKSGLPPRSKGKSDPVCAPDRMHFYRRGLLVVRDWRLRETPPEKVLVGGKALNFRIHRKLTREELAGAVARVGKYPKSYLRMPGWLALALLKGLEKIKLYAVYGGGKRLREPA